jgi:alkylated DNA repair dioxygenase AlkB
VDDADATTVIGINPDAVTERIDLGEGSWVDVTRDWLLGADELYAALKESVAWQQGRMFRYERMVEERRLSAGWQRGRPLPHPSLAEVHKTLQRTYKVEFPGFSLIQYRDGRDGQGFHRDTDMKWLDDTRIAILTLGAKRPWLLRPWAAKFDKRDHSPGRGATHDLAPGGGDLLVMGGRCQADWQHSVPYLPSRPVAPRISLQWRWTSRRGEPFRGSSYGAPLTYSR